MLCAMVLAMPAIDNDLRRPRNHGMVHFPAFLQWSSPAERLVRFRHKPRDRIG